MGGWAHPTSVADPDSGWNNDAKAINGIVGDGAEVAVLDKFLIGQYSGGFEDCTHLRVLAGELVNTTPVSWAGARVTIQAKWDDVWHTVWTYAGDGLTENGYNGDWTYITIDGGAAHDVTAISVKVTAWEVYHVVALFEMDFGRVPKEHPLIGEPNGTVPGNGATEVSKRSAMWTPPFAYADTQKLYWDDSSPPTTLRKTENTDQDVGWYGPGENDWLSDTTYHWRVDATNDVTDDLGIGPTVGTELSFTTDAACYKVYRGQDGEIDYGQPQAEMDLSDTQVSIPAQDLPPDTIWHYIRREVSHCGLESEDSPACIVIIDADGEMRGATPNAPQSVTIEPLVAAKFWLRWRHTPVYEEIPPSGFNIYMAAAGEEFDFGSPIATIPYGFGWTGEFSWTSGELTNDVTYRFCIRSYRAGGGESQNTNYVAAVADSQGPDAITNLLATWEEI